MNRGLQFGSDGRQKGEAEPLPPRSAFLSMLALSARAAETPMVNFRRQ
jgi:hypothetical protein